MFYVNFLTDWINVPFERTNYSRDYYFNGDFESVIPVTIIFPKEWAGRYITGRLGISGTFSHPNQFFYDVGQTFNQSDFDDYTERYQIYTEDLTIADGLTVSVSPTGGTGASDYIAVVFNFNNFYVPIDAYGTSTYMLGFHLNYHFSFNAVYHKDGSNTYEAGLLTALTQQAQIVNVGTFYSPNFTGAGAQLDNSYYTLIQALYDSDIDTLLTGLTDYFTSWVGEPSSAITNNWADFSAAVINTLGGIATNVGSSSPLIPQINQIYNLLFNAMAQDGYLTTWFSDFYDLLNGVEYNVGNIDDNTSVITGEIESRYNETLGNYIANVYFALTGWNETIGNSGITMDDLDDQMVERWRFIVMCGLSDYFGDAPSASEAAEYATQVADVDTGVTTQHTGEQAAYDAAMTQFNTYVSAGFFRANTQIMPASVWYVSAINAIHSRLGKLAIPITVSFALGLIVAILGRVNRFAILTRRNGDPS